jgi:hypothetical protein
MKEKNEALTDKEDILDKAGFSSDTEGPVPYVPLEMAGSSQSAYSNPYPKGVPPFIYQDHAQPQYSFPTTRSPGQFLKEDTGTPGGIENFAHTWKQFNFEFQAGKFLANSFSPNQLLEDVPDGWRVEPEDLTEFDDRFWYTLRTATGPKELDSRKQAIRDQIKDDEYFANGGWFSSLAGGFAGAITSPGSLYSLKFLTNFKYATVPKTMMMNALSSAPAIGIESFARNSMIQANRQGGSMEDAAFDAVTDTVFGSALMGVGSGLGKLNHDLKLWDARKSFSLYSQKGIKIDPVFKDGKLTGEVTFTPAPGESLSAAETDLAKSWYSEHMDRNGLFALPYVGEAISKSMNIPGLRSPAVIASRNRFTSAKKWFNDIAGSPFYTAGEAAGIASETPAQIIALRYSSRALDFTLFSRKQWMKANGIDGDTSFARIKSFKQGVSRNREISENDFGAEALKILSDETYRSPYSEAHGVADEMHNIFTQMNEKYSELTGRPMFKDPRNAWRYFPVKDNISNMKTKQDLWEHITNNALAEQDRLITEIEKPIENSKARIKSLQETIKSMDKKDPKVRDFKNQLNSTKGLLERQLEDYNHKIANNTDYGILLEERNPMSGEERKQLRELLEPVKKAQSVIDKHQSKLELLLESKKTFKKNSDEFKSLTKEILNEENSLKVAQEAKENLEMDLQERAFNREIHPNLFHEDGHEIKFHNPDEHPVLRRPFKTDRERSLAVKAMWTTRMELSPNDIVSSVFHHFSPNVSMPNYFKQRTHMVPTSIYIENGFQDTDVASLMTSYMQTVGRSFGFMEAMPEFATTRGFDGALRGISQEYEKMKAEIFKKPESNSRDKEINQLHEDYKSAQKFMKDTYDAYFGINGKDMDPNARGIITVAKNVTVSALMGGIVAYQLQELGATMMKHGIMNTFSAGLKPMILSMFERVRGAKGPELESWRSNAAHIGLALNTEINAQNSKWFNPGVLNEPPGNAAMSMAISSSQKLSHYSMNFFGVNLLSNVNERLAASTFQSRAMKAMADHLKGTLSNDERIAMAHYGLDVNRDAKLFIEQMNQSGGWNKGRQFQSMYYKWADHEAMNRMGDAMRRAVRDTVVNSDRFSSPYWTNNPLLSLVFMFHGWAYNAFNRYAVPLMQRPHAEQVLGATIMVGLSMMAPPLLRLANGKDFFKDDEKWYHASFEGLEYSGLLGPNWDLLANMNKFLGDPLFQSTEKRTGFNPHGAINGPVLGTLFGVGDALAHGAKRDMTQGDLKQLSRIMPGRSHVALRQVFDYFIANSGLPVKRPKE